MLTKNFRIPQRVADDLNYIKLRNSGAFLLLAGFLYLLFRPYKESKTLRVNTRKLAGAK